jgi:hypothetical protein
MRKIIFILLVLIFSIAHTEKKPDRWPQPQWTAEIAVFMWYGKYDPDKPRFADEVKRGKWFYDETSESMAIILGRNEGELQVDGVYYRVVGGKCKKEERDFTPFRLPADAIYNYAYTPQKWNRFTSVGKKCKTHYYFDPNDELREMETICPDSRTEIEFKKYWYGAPDKRVFKVPSICRKRIGVVFDVFDTYII